MLLLIEIKNKNYVKMDEIKQIIIKKNELILNNNSKLING
jgi:hypothetical protein